jgi:hypothetical protein
MSGYLISSTGGRDTPANESSFLYRENEESVKKGSMAGKKQKNAIFY